MNETIRNIFKMPIFYPVVLMKHAYEYYLAKHNPPKLMCLRYSRNMGIKLNLDNPVNLDEKVNYMSFYTDTSLWTELADKVKVRDYVKKCGYGDILNEIYGVYNSPDQIDISKLPDAFILKTNHASATNYFVKNKNKYNHAEVKKIFNKWLNMDYGFKTATPHYSKINPCIFAEKYLIEHKDTDKSLTDYKIYCFKGKPLYIFVFSDRVMNSHEFKKMIYDKDWNAHPEYINKGLVHGKIMPKPKSLDLMLRIASELSKPFPFVRVDLYEIKDSPIFSELTFTPGHNSAASPEFLKIMGDLIDLDEITLRIA